MSFLIEKTLSNNDIESFLSQVSRDQLLFGDYPVIDEEKIRNYSKSRLSHLTDNDFFIISQNETGIAGLLKVQYLDFDSEQLELRCYRISEILFSHSADINLTLAILLQGLNFQIKKLNIQYLVNAINMNNSRYATIFNGLLKNDFYYISTLVTTYIKRGEYDKIRHVPLKFPELVIRESVPQDIHRLMNIAEKSYQIDRFHLDPNLDKKKCDKLYSTSIENSFLHGTVDIIFVSEFKGLVIGYYTGKKYYISEMDMTIGDGRITAVDEQYRKYGAYTQMHDQFLKWSSEFTDISELGTYMNNIPVHRAFTNSGLNIVRGTHQLARFVK
jgi:hypothetical protein